MNCNKQYHWQTQSSIFEDENADVFFNSPYYSYTAVFDDRQNELHVCSIVRKKNTHLGADVFVGFAGDGLGRGKEGEANRPESDPPLGRAYVTILNGRKFRCVAEALRLLGRWSGAEMAANNVERGVGSPECRISI